MRAPGRIRWLCFLSLACIAVSCVHDECEQYQQRCDGNQRMVCQEGSCHDPSCALSPPDRHWQSEACEHACVEHAGQTFCALSNAPDPACSAERDRCQGDALLSCRGGFLVGRRECAAKDHAVCVDRELVEPICALSRTPDERCQPVRKYGGTVCDGMQTVKCDYAYAVSTQPCGFACVSEASGDAFCAASSDKDPRCEDISFRTGVSCGSDAAGICHAGYVECLPTRRAGDDDAGARDAADSDGAP
jgi:hypothetical protein